MLFSIAEKSGFLGRYVVLLEAICSEAETRFQRSLPINATGDSGHLPRVGLVGHLAEEMPNPLAREIWKRAEKEVFDNRPQ